MFDAGLINGDEVPRLQICAARRAACDTKTTFNNLAWDGSVRKLTHRSSLSHFFFEVGSALLKQLAGGGELAGEAQTLAQRRKIVGDDPLPYGLAKNRRAMEAIIRFALDQKILPRAVEPEAMFPSNTLGLE